MTAKAAAILLAVAVISTLLACQTAASKPEPETTEIPNKQPMSPITLTQPSVVQKPEHASLTTPDPTREAMTNRTIENFSNRITDLTYFAALGKIAESDPANLPNHVAARENHKDCLRETRNDAIKISSPERPLPTRSHEYDQDAMAEALAECFQQKSLPWEEFPTQERSVWITYIIESAARTKNPAEHYRTIHPQSQDSEQWKELYKTYAPCENLVTPHAEQVGSTKRAKNVTPALVTAILNIEECFLRATNEQSPPSPEQPENISEQPTESVKP